MVKEMVDVENDVEIGHVDILKIISKIGKEKLEVVFYLRELPDELTINQDKLQEGRNEYYWRAEIDVDNDSSTGSSDGIDYILQVRNFKKGKSKTGPIDKVFYAYFGKYIYKNAYTSYGLGVLNVDLEADTITIAAEVPGINEDSVITYSTYDVNLGGIPEHDVLN